MTLYVRVEPGVADVVYPLGSLVEHDGEPPEGWIVYPHGEPIPDEHDALRQVFGGDTFPDFRGRVMES